MGPGMNPGSGDLPAPAWGLRNPPPWRWQSPRWPPSRERGDIVAVSRGKRRQTREGRSSGKVDVQRGGGMRLTSGSSPVLVISEKFPPARPRSLFLLDLDAVSVRVDERVRLEAEIIQRGVEGLRAVGLAQLALRHEEL